MASPRIGRGHERLKSWILVPVMVVSSGRENESGTGADDASVYADRWGEEVEEGLKVIAHLWAKLWTIAWSPGRSPWSHRAWTLFLWGDGWAGDVQWAVWWAQDGRTDVKWRHIQCWQFGAIRWEVQVSTCVGIGTNFSEPDQDENASQIKFWAGS